MDLRPPIRRSWLRLRLGKAYYTGKRYLLWCSPKYRWAKIRKEERLPCVQFSHATPLMRHLRGEEMVWQENKVTNLKLAVKRLDGLILYPGETFSYWKRIGKPTARKGYKEGMVLSAGSALATVASENDDLEIMAMVTVNDRPLLHVGDPCKIAITGLSEYSYGTLTGTVTSIDSDVTSSNNGSYYKMTIKPDATYVVSRSGDKVDLSNGMSVTARVEYDQVTYFEYAMEALGVLFR